MKKKKHFCEILITYRQFKMYSDMFVQTFTLIVLCLYLFFAPTDSFH